MRRGYIITDFVIEVCCFKSAFFLPGAVIINWLLGRTYFRNLVVFWTCPIKFLLRFGLYYISQFRDVLVVASFVATILIVALGFGAAETLRLRIVAPALRLLGGIFEKVLVIDYGPKEAIVPFK